MKRFAEQCLLEWKNRSGRKPLIVRGARQTGKTYLIDRFAEQHFENFLKIDFEFDAEAKSVFETPDPEKIVAELSLLYDRDIVAGRTLLFLDEIQACPPAIFSLRYFYEKMPELHVVAAGSLLEFALRDFNYSMPVGRIEFLQLNPMTFEEFLLAHNPKLLSFLQNLSIREGISPAIHQKARELLRLFFFIGGMPEAVASFVRNRNFLEVQRIQNGVATTMQHDFAKYGSRLDQDVLRKTLRFVPGNIGRKVKYVNIDRDIRSAVLKDALGQLALSKAIHLVRKTAGNGLPLDAESSADIFKAIFLDIGLANNISGLKLAETDELIAVYEGRLAEQFVGQELLNSGQWFEEKELFYWAREKKNANAEIDYLLAHRNRVVPVEVKAGKTGGLKSLHLFLHEKGLRLGLRFNTDVPSVGEFDAAVRYENKKDNLRYVLLSLPMYLAGQTERLLDETADAIDGGKLQAPPPVTRHNE